MKNYKQILLLGILAISINCFGNDYFQIKRIEKGSYAIPLVSNKEHPEIAEKINQFIQMTTVYKSYKVVGDRIFDGMINEDGYTGTISLDYTILLNSEAILSIQFNDETLTAYPDTHTYYLNFNSANGDIIDLSELLNLSGVHHLNDQASITFNNSIHAYQNDAMKDNSLDTSNRNEQLEAVFQMTECNSTHNIWKFGITEDLFVVEKDRCFPHVMQALDIGWGCEIKIQDLFDSDFTPFGSTLLVKMNPDTSKHYNQKLETMSLYGKIDNKYRFCMYLYIYEDNSIGGHYWYSKFGNLIDLRGSKVSPNKIIVKEETGGQFELILNDNGNISGNWNSQGKSFPIVFE